MKFVVSLLLFTTLLPAYAMEYVYDAAADGNAKETVSLLSSMEADQVIIKTKTEAVETSTKETMKHAEKVKEYTGKIADYAKKIDDYTDKIQQWVGDAKKWTIDKIEVLTGIEDLEQNCTLLAKESIEIGKTLYGVYDVGKNVYDTGYNAYESFASSDMTIDSMIENMETLSSARKDIMTEIQTLSYKSSMAGSLNEIQKNQTGINAAQLKMQALHAQETEQTNMILLQQQAKENAERRYQYSIYDNYEKSQLDMWKQYYKNNGETDDQQEEDYDFYEE